MPIDPYVEDIIARDRALPGLRALLDPAAFLSVLRTHDGADAASDAAISYVRYKPGQSCLVGFELATASGPALAYAKSYRPDQHDKLAKAAVRFRVGGKSEGGGFVDTGRGLVVARFPHDAELRGLRRLRAPASQVVLLEELFGTSSPWTGGELELIRYKPERRCVSLLRVDGRPIAALKFYTEATYRGILARSTAFRSGANVRVPAVVGTSDRYSVVAFEWLPWNRLTEQLLDQSVSEDVLAQVGQSLALLHAQDGGDLPLSTADASHRALSTVAESLAFLLPQHARRIDGVTRRVTTALSGIPDSSRPIHGDFYSHQILIQDGKIGILDFDESARGNPLSDVGNFIAHLERNRMRSGLDRDAIQAYEEAFIAGYMAHAGGGISRGDVARSAAAALLKLAPHPFRRVEPDWPERTLQILERADEMVALGERTAPTSLAQISAPALDPRMPQLETALDPACATTALRAVAGAETATVERAQLLRHKPGRRALIAYTLRLVPNAPTTTRWLGKMRAKGVDRETYTRSCTMWEHGFHRENAAGVSIAEPIGVLPAWNLWLQCEEAGAVATERLRDPDGTAVARQIGTALAYLHAAGPVADRVHTVGDEVRILEERLALVGLATPAWAPRLEALLSACRGHAAAHTEVRMRPIHWDFYADNILVDGNRTIVLDLDLYSMGDPALDAGNFLAHLIEQGVREANNADRFALDASAFTGAFLASSPDVPDASVQWYTTLALARHVHISTLFPDRRAYTETLLALCEARLGLAPRGVPPESPHHEIHP